MDRVSTERCSRVIYVDLDDFCEDNTSLKLLEDIKRDIPGFRVTLFTIVGRSSKGFIDRINDDYDWIRMVPHGWEHRTSRECEHWSYDQSLDYLWMVTNNYPKLKPGFKAPGWQISDGMYCALAEMKFWVADQLYNNKRRPAGLPVYLLDSPDKIHGHIGHLGGFNANELSLILPQIMTVKDREFGFIEDAIYV